MLGWICTAFFTFGLIGYFLHQTVSWNRYLIKETKALIEHYDACCLSCARLSEGATYLGDEFISKTKQRLHHYISLKDRAKDDLKQLEKRWTIRVFKS